MTNNSNRGVPYSEIFPQITESKLDRHFFAASNSSDGFVSYFYEIFTPDRFDTLYLLGGGPGSGKSTMLKRVAKLSLENGFLTEQFHCSSSPFSLDGVAIPQKRIAVIDATSPHTYTPVAAGVREISINPGEAWDTLRLSQNRELIYSLTKSKQAMYRRAYILIKAQSLIDDELRTAVYSCIDTSRLEKSVLSHIAKLKVGNSDNAFSKEIRLQAAFCGEGKVFLESLARCAEKVFWVDNYKGIGHLFLEKLYNQAKSCGLAVTLSYDPIKPHLIDGIFFNASRVAFSIYASSYDRCIHCESFADKSEIRSIRHNLMLSQKAGTSLMLEASLALKNACELHEKIEAEYAKCTDYSITEKISQKLCRAIFDI